MNDLLEKLLSYSKSYPKTVILFLLGVVIVGSVWIVQQQSTISGLLNISSEKEKLMQSRVDLSEEKRDVEVQKTVLKYDSTIVSLNRELAEVRQGNFAEFDSLLKRHEELRDRFTAIELERNKLNEVLRNNEQLLASKDNRIESLNEKLRGLYANNQELLKSVSRQKLEIDSPDSANILISQILGTLVELYSSISDFSSSDIAGSENERLRNKIIQYFESPETEVEILRVFSKHSYRHSIEQYLSRLKHLYYEKVDIFVHPDYAFEKVTKVREDEYEVAIQIWQYFIGRHHEDIGYRDKTLKRVTFKIKREGLYDWEIKIKEITSIKVEPI